MVRAGGGGGGGGKRGSGEEGEREEGERKGGWGGEVFGFRLPNARNLVNWSS